ncbi:MAG: AAA family ATPase [Deltaproteobacteria bacterium]|jgi:class 3 adenylate cyclase|nr:AAA family ATPase [Deltaproteobacteria bacterium]MBT4642140.1 AAA family ATPase [Deltaproteobacteria bacterium]MBT6499884.1 AAA family ATPase [Deltaproteobacteria bacterium]MBT7154954.1 AAA family ATPase [Deltaproteobacteria bacterium]MBT7714726.1 AAA family ATPase [Deltaproteobacteria bacterium]
MKCQKCESENSENRKFCRECGVKLLVICPECKSENLPVDKFCGECGGNLRKSSESSALDFEKPETYTPQHLSSKILSTRQHIEGERKLVTVFFADVAEFTAMSEKNDPEDIRNIMDGCFEILMNHIHRYEGTITQFLGDGLMALFGAPLAHEDHARRACFAGLAVQKDLVAYGGKVKKEYGFDFKMRIGLNSGMVMVGSVGDDLRMDYIAVGDTVNLAARMETAANRGTVLVSKNVHNLVQAYFEFESRGKLDLKGKKEAQDAFELLQPSAVDTRIDASAAKGFNRFVGRKKSLEVLQEAFETASRGSGQVVGLVGDAGVGKSRLLIEFSNQQLAGDFTYLEGQCFQFGGNIIYLPILSILKSYFRILESDTEAIVKKKLREKIQALDDTLISDISPLQDILSVPVDDESYQELEPRQKREQIFEAVRNILIKESENRPVVIALDDMHWIDKSSEAILDFLIGWLANTHILLILLYRPEYSHPWNGKSYYTRIGLDQLSDESSIDLLKAILDEGQVAPELGQLILDKAAGNPLYVE